MGVGLTKKEKGLRYLVLMSLLTMLLGSYLGSYLALSRRGFAHADQMGYEGFYFFPPQDNNSWRLRQQGCAVFYFPLIEIDKRIGTGRTVGSEPMWGLS